MWCSIQCVSEWFQVETDSVQRWRHAYNDTFQRISFGAIGGPRIRNNGLLQCRSYAEDTLTKVYIYLSGGDNQINSCVQKFRKQIETKLYDIWIILCRQIFMHRALHLLCRSLPLQHWTFQFLCRPLFLPWRPLSLQCRLQTLLCRTICIPCRPLHERLHLVLKYVQ